MYVDNMFAFSTSSAGAEMILADFEHIIRSEWNLEIKATSREMVVCRGQKNTSDPCIWKVCRDLSCLGHIVSDDGGIRNDWNQTKIRMWKVFWKNSGNSRIGTCKFETKLSLLLRSVFCTVNWKFSRWPFAKSVAIELDAMQVNMVSYLNAAPQTRFGRLGYVDPPPQAGRT